MSLNVTLRIVPGPGYEKWGMMKACLKLAVTEWRAAEVEWNGRTYRLDPDAVIDRAVCLEECNDRSPTPEPTQPPVTP